MIKSSIKKISKEIHKDVVMLRRHLHQYPELSFQEKKTGKFISDILKKNNIKHTTGWAGNGVVALITGSLKGENTIALRADIDALPIQEKSRKKYSSKNVGIMHACGHDVHTASLLGAVIILEKLKPQFGGTIKCVFQPAEEKLPGGASILIKEGVLLKPDVKTMLGQHVHPPLSAGKVGIRGGQYMASADELYLKVRGTGGHGALPQNCIDTVYVASQIIIALQQVISRRKDPLIPSVLTFGKINSEGGAPNVIPDIVNIEGTFRSMNEKWRFKAHKIIKHTVQKTAEALGAKCDVNILVGYPSLYNNEKYTAQIKKSMVAFLGKSNVVDLPMRMTAEDFAWYSQKIPSCFYRLGTGNKKKGIVSPVHTATFDVDEKCLETSIGLMSFLAIESLSY